MLHLLAEYLVLDPYVHFCVRTRISALMLMWRGVPLST